MEWKDITGDRLYYKMSKNDKADSLKLPQPVNVNLDHYRIGSDYIFPDLKNLCTTDSKTICTRIKSSIKRHNANMKTIAGLAGIDNKITNHIAWHSFENIARDKVSPQMLQKLYRHTHLSTTID